jgi:hypothetical protein
VFVVCGPVICTRTRRGGPARAAQLLAGRRAQHDQPPLRPAPRPVSADIVRSSEAGPGMTGIRLRFRPSCGLSRAAPKIHCVELQENRSRCVGL